MRSTIALIALVPLLAGCPTYDRYGKLDDQDGLVDGDTFARYGREQAQKVAIGRTLAAAYEGDSREAHARQIGAAVAYARTMPDIVHVAADTAAYFLNVTFRSGWQVAVLPIADGKSADETPNLPARPAARP